MPLGHATQDHPSTVHPMSPNLKEQCRVLYSLRTAWEAISLYFEDCVGGHFSSPFCHTCHTLRPHHAPPRSSKESPVQTGMLRDARDTRANTSCRSCTFPLPNPSQFLGGVPVPFSAKVFLITQESSRPAQRLERFIPNPDLNFGVPFTTAKWGHDKRLQSLKQRSQQHMQSWHYICCKL